jgi:hypothetical protein
MVRSITRQGIFTMYDPNTRRMRQKNYDNRVRFSLETYSYEDAWKADDRVDVMVGASARGMFCAAHAGRSGDRSAVWKRERCCRPSSMACLTVVDPCSPPGKGLL